MTRSIKAENIPASISADYISAYFKSVQNGGGPVSDVQLFPEKNSAIITFCDHKGNTVLCLTKVLPDGGPERKLLQIWALGEAWFAVTKAGVHCPVPGKCSGFRNTAACLGFQNLSGFFCYQRYILIPAVCMGYSH